MTVTFYLDEANMAKDLVKALKYKHFSVITAQDVRLAGTNDDNIHLDFCYKNKYILLTTDEALQKFLKKRINLPAIFIIKQDLIQKERYGYILRNIQKYLNFYTIEVFNHFWVLFYNKLKL